DAHLHVVGFAGEDGDRLVLCLPAETGNGAIVAAAIGDAQDAEFLAKRRGGVVAAQDFAVLNPVEDSQAKRLQGDAEANIAVRELGLEVGGRQDLSGAGVGLAGGENVGPAYDGEKLMDAAVRSSVRLLREPNFADRAKLRDERGHMVGSALAVGDEVKHRIFR